jgi:hypothetical protein
MNFPWTIHEADVAIYPARMDGWPLVGPSPVRGSVPLLEFHTSLRIDTLLAAGTPAGMDFTGSPLPRAEGYSIQVEIPEGPRRDGLSLAASDIEPTGYYCIVVRFEDSGLSGHWHLWRFFYVVPDGDSTGDQDQVMRRSLRFRSGYRQIQSGVGTLPALRPEPLGEVEWLCGPLRVVALLYDPATGTYTSTEQNVASTAVDAAPFVAVGETDGRGWLSYFLPQAENSDGDTLAGDLALAGTPLTVAWRHVLALLVEPSPAAVIAQPGFVLQSNGTPEPLLRSSQSRLWDEPMVIFRYLNRIYASVGHGTVAIPAISADPPPPTHEPDFRLGILRLLPFGGYLPPP